VTLGDDTSKLLALERARQRLEAALANDDGWRALRRLNAAADRGGGEAGRLEIPMLANPLYRAWKNVNAAIEARQSDRSADCGSASVWPSPQAGVGLAATGKVANLKAGKDPTESRGGAGQRQGDRAVPVPTPEASVSFIVRASAPARAASEQRQAEPRGPSQAEQQGQHPLAASGPPFADDAVAVPSAPAEEAQVAVVSVAARRHADAVERLLRALHGQEGAK
jgi:hypothetical protein